MTKVGEIDQRVIDLLNLTVEPKTPVFIGESNIEHMKESHPEDYEEYKEQIPKIIKSPDYVGIKPNDKSIEYVKVFIVENKYVKVAVRVSVGGVYFARSIYTVEEIKINSRVGKGTLKKIDQTL
jgi:hypothetical protein